MNSFFTNRVGNESPEEVFYVSRLLDLEQTEHKRLFKQCKYPWEVLSKIGPYLRETVKRGIKNVCVGEAYIGKDVYIGEGSVVEDGAMILGPAYIGKNVVIRHGAYIRENVIVGDGCVVGNSTELKNCILFNEVQVPHFNYVGDSILGYKVHLGAGVIISNLRSIPGNVKVKYGEIEIDTGLRKFGAVVGDKAEIGCNVVLNPGSIIGRGSVVYPCVSWRGYLPPFKIVKNKANFEISELEEKDDCKE